MLAKCAAPGCSAAFHYLHQGRVFVFEAGKPGEGRMGGDDLAPAAAGPRYAWLCEGCLRRFTLTCDASGDLRLVERSQPESSDEACPSLLWGT